MAITNDQAEEPSDPIGTARVSHGTVKWWQDAKGYGVISVPETAPWDVWCHFSVIEPPTDDFRALAEGESVEVEYYRLNREGFRYVASAVRRR